MNNTKYKELADSLKDLIDKCGSIDLCFDYLDKDKKDYISKEELLSELKLSESFKTLLSYIMSALVLFD